MEVISCWLLGYRGAGSRELEFRWQKGTAGGRGKLHQSRSPGGDAAGRVFSRGRRGEEAIGACQREETFGMFGGLVDLPASGEGDDLRTERRGATGTVIEWSLGHIC